MFTLERKGIAVVVTMLCVAVGMFFVGQSAAGEIKPLKSPVKVGAITSTSKFDYAWGTSNFRAMKMLEEEFGAEVTFLDTVPMVEQAKIFKDFSETGFDLMLGWGYEFLDSANKVASEYPDLPFLVTCAPHPGSAGYAPNLASMYFTEEEAGYLAGVLAASLSKTKKVGFVSGTDIPCASKTLNAFRLGAYHTDPKVKVLWAWMGSWADVAKERELTNALIDEGADIMFPLWIGLAAAEVSDERGVYVIGSQYLDEYKPDRVIAVHFEDMSLALKMVYETLLKGQYEAKPYQMTMARGVTDLRMNDRLIPNVVSYELRDKIKTTKQAIIDGSIEVPRLVRELPKEWPHKTVSNYEEYLEPKFVLVKE
jgi:basic membrane protein A